MIDAASDVVYRSPDDRLVGGDRKGQRALDRHHDEQTGWRGDEICVFTCNFYSANEAFVGYNFYVRLNDEIASFDEITSTVQLFDFQSLSTFCYFVIYCFRLLVIFSR